MIKKSITEEALLYHLECPLRTNGLVTLPESPVLKCSQETWRWLTSEVANGREPTAQDTRDRFDQEWQRTNFYQSRDTIPQKKYERQVFEGVRACARMRRILFRCELLQPVSPYELTIDGIGITGEYAVVRSSRRKRQAFVLYLRYRGVKIRPLTPDIVSFARWVHFSNEPNTRLWWGVDDISVKHYWVNQELDVEHRPDRQLASAVLLGVAGVVSGPPFPIVGEHCLSCPTHSCNSKPLGHSAKRAKRRGQTVTWPKKKQDLKIISKERQQFLQRQFDLQNQPS